MGMHRLHQITNTANTGQINHVPTQTQVAKEDNKHTTKNNIPACELLCLSSELYYLEDSQFVA